MMRDVESGDVTTRKTRTMIVCAAENYIRFIIIAAAITVVWLLLTSHKAEL
jgi:hypothetical protein